MQIARQMRPLRQAAAQANTVMTSPIMSPRIAGGHGHFSFRGNANPTVLSAENVAFMGSMGGGTQQQLAEMLYRSTNSAGSADQGDGHRRGRSVSQVRPFASTARDKVAIHDPDILHAVQQNAKDYLISPERTGKRQHTATDQSFTVRGHKADRYARVNLKTQAAARANSHTLNGFQAPRLKHMEVSDGQ